MLLSTPHPTQFGNDCNLRLPTQLARSKKLRISISQFIFQFTLTGQLCVIPPQNKHAWFLTNSF
jgi:hypothetical protein